MNAIQIIAILEAVAIVAVLIFGRCLARRREQEADMARIRAVMRASLLDDLAAEFGREIDACLDETVADWAGGAA